MGRCQNFNRCRCRTDAEERYRCRCRTDADAELLAEILRSSAKVRQYFADADADADAKKSAEPADADADAERSAHHYL
ncbi:unnamed protein product [Rotaria magnacalcarata]|uniref:Uncharacterized protein n=1 Tax=Rotaria magnacalcarata TaxID=392030 RepID=A0A816UB34_9BILA|nr:unnamed protein product [Rotaria magnacalcarata]